MKILLVNVDSRFNIALRRLYNCYLSSGHTVKEIDLKLPAYPHKKLCQIDATGFDKVWVSNLFEINANRVIVTGCANVDYGGIGSNFPANRIPQ